MFHEPDNKIPDNNPNDELAPLGEDEREESPDDVEPGDFEDEELDEDEYAEDDTFDEDDELEE